MVSFGTTNHLPPMTTEPASTLAHETLRPQYGVWALADTLAAAARKAKRTAARRAGLRPLTTYTVR